MSPNYTNGEIGAQGGLLAYSNMDQTEDLSVENAIACEKEQDSDTGTEKAGGGDGEHQLEQTSSVATDSIPQVPVIGQQDPQTIDDILYEPYLSELQMPSIVQLMKASLSEPYSIYTYRYFIHKWPQLCKLAMYNGECVGAIVCKLEPHHFNIRRGYIAMLAVAKDFRRKKIGQFLFYGHSLIMSLQNGQSAYTFE